MDTRRYLDRPSSIVYRPNQEATSAHMYQCDRRLSVCIRDMRPSSWTNLERHAACPVALQALDCDRPSAGQRIGRRGPDDIDTPIIGRRRAVRVSGVDLAVRPGEPVADTLALLETERG